LDCADNVLEKLQQILVSKSMVEVKKCH